MNKRITKWLKKEAAELPVEVGMRLVIQKFKGYNTHNNEAFTVNHYEVLKELYKQHGEAAVKTYLTQHAKQKELHVSASDTQKLTQEANTLND